MMSAVFFRFLMRPLHRGSVSKRLDMDGLVFKMFFGDGASFSAGGPSVSLRAIFVKSENVLSSSLDVPVGDRWRTPFALLWTHPSKRRLLHDWNRSLMDTAKPWANVCWRQARFTSCISIVKVFNPSCNELLYNEGKTAANTDTFTLKYEVFLWQTCSLSNIQIPVHLSFLVNYCSLIHLALTVSRALHCKRSRVGLFTPKLQSRLPW